MTIAHKRQRIILGNLIKKLSFAPVISLQGPRQSGKSFLVRHLLSEKVKNIKYLSLDNKETRTFAENNPRAFLEQGLGQIFIIDEAQKSPDLFDEVKAIIDTQRKPGQFILLGSTEFSHETKIRESLTGRMSRIRIFPLSLAEVKKLTQNNFKQYPYLSLKPRVSKQDLFNYLENGGFPGIFNVRSAEEQKQLFSDWLNLTVERDLYQIKKYKLNSQLALNILSALVKLEDTSIASVSKYLRVSSRSTESHLKALCSLYAVVTVAPFIKSTGKTQHYLTDTGLVHFLGGGFEKKLETFFTLQLKAQLVFNGRSENELMFFKTARGQPVQFCVQDKNQLYFSKLIFTQKIDQRDFLIFQSITQQFKGQNIHFSAFYGGSEKMTLNEVNLYPWESLI